MTDSPITLVKAASPATYVNLPSSEQSALDFFRDLWAYRDVARAFFIRNLRVRYKETFFGIGWAIIQPAALIVPFVVVLGRVAKISGGGVPYAAFSIVAVSVFQFASTGIQTSALALVQDAALARKVYFPRLVPVLATVGGAGVDLSIAIVMAIPLGWILGGHPSFWVLALPIALIPLLFATIAISAAMAILNVHYRDIKYALPFVIQLFLYGSPVSYPLSKLSHQLQYIVCAINPFAGSLDAVKHVAVNGDAPNYAILLVGLASSIVWFYVSIVIFRKLEHDLADVV